MEWAIQLRTMSAKRNEMSYDYEEMRKEREREEVDRAWEEAIKDAKFGFILLIVIAISGAGIYWILTCDIALITYGFLVLVTILAAFSVARILGHWFRPKGE